MWDYIFLTEVLAWERRGRKYMAITTILNMGRKKLKSPAFWKTKILLAYYYLRQPGHTQVSSSVSYNKKWCCKLNVSTYIKQLLQNKVLNTYHYSALANHPSSLLLRISLFPVVFSPLFVNSCFNSERESPFFGFKCFKVCTCWE